MGFFRDVSISGAGSSFLQYIRQKRDHNALFWLAACMPPGLIILAFQIDSTKTSTPPPPPPIYFESWPADRSIEETRQAQQALQARKDEIERKKRDTYRALGRASGMDVDAIERDALAMRAESEARAAARKAAADKARGESAQGAAPGQKNGSAQ